MLTQDCLLALTKNIAAVANVKHKKLAFTIIRSSQNLIATRSPPPHPPLRPKSGVSKMRRHCQAKVQEYGFCLCYKKGNEKKSKQSYTGVKQEKCDPRIINPYLQNSYA
jgi:hypothetical protein